MSEHLAVQAVIGSAHTTRFKSVLHRTEERRGRRNIDLLSLSSGGYLYPRTKESDRQQASDQNLARCLVVHPGDLVVNPMWLTGGSIAVADRIGAVSPDYRVFRPSKSAWPRYIHHLLRAPGYVDQYRLYTRADTTFDRRVQQEDLDELPIPLPPVAHQRRIADFLDDQVARIDSIIAAREQQLALTDGMRLNLARDLIAQLDTGSGPPLSAVALIVDTEHKTAPEATGGGRWSAWTGAIRRGELVRPLLREIDHSTYLEWTRRTVPVPGDVLLTREAPVGEVALLGADDQNVAIGQRVVLVRPTQLDSEYLRLVLMSPVFDRLVADTTQGSLHPHLNMGDIARMRVPEADMTEQANLGYAFTAALAEVLRDANVLQMSIDRFGELKRSLITAAVSGEFDVSSADGSRVSA